MSHHSAQGTASRRAPLGAPKLLRRWLKDLASVPLVLQFVTEESVGKEYGVGAFAKLRLVRRLRKNGKFGWTESLWQEHLEMASCLLSIPASVKGDVIEMGCFKGGSSVSLSTVCALVGRRLVICDSFEGLPEPELEEKQQHSLFSGQCDVYEKGRFAATADEVKGNLDRFGRLDVCDFVVGFFDKSLDGFDRPCVMAFFDADLVTSLKPCLLAIWPHLRAGHRFYVHEATSLSLVELFFDREWWNENLSTTAPGFVGAGTGLPLLPVLGSELGFAAKQPDAGAPASAPADA